MVRAPVVSLDNGDRPSLHVAEHALITGAGYAVIGGDGDDDEHDEHQPRKEQEEKGRYLDTANNAVTMEASQLGHAGMPRLPGVAGGTAPTGTANAVAPVSAMCSVIS